CFPVGTFSTDAGTGCGRDQTRQPTLDEMHNLHGVSTFCAWRACEMRFRRMITVTTEPNKISATAIARNSPRPSKRGSNRDARLATTNTHMRAGLAMGPSKKFPTPLA